MEHSEFSSKCVCPWGDIYWLYLLSLKWAHYLCVQYKTCLNGRWIDNGKYFWVFGVSVLFFWGVFFGLFPGQIKWHTAEKYRMSSKEPWHVSSVILYFWGLDWLEPTYFSCWGNLFIFIHLTDHIERQTRHDVIYPLFINQGFIEVFFFFCHKHLGGDMLFTFYVRTSHKFRNRSPCVLECPSFSPAFPSGITPLTLPPRAHLCPPSPFSALWFPGLL